MDKQVLLDSQRRLAEAIRDACFRAAVEGYERAAMAGLCHEGAWECAVDAIRTLNIEAVLQAVAKTEAASD